MPKTLHDYRPQHDEDCAAFKCSNCHGRISLVQCRQCFGVLRNPCTCGLDALLQSSEEERTPCYCCASGGCQDGCRCQERLGQSSEGLHEEKKDHCAGLAAVGNDTGRSTTEAASDVVTVSREAAEDALQYAWNAGVAGAWKCVREMFADGRDVRGWAISVEKHSAPVAANWQQARDLLFGSASSSISEASTNNAQERSAEKP
jgi:hypothetical protein